MKKLILAAALGFASLLSLPASAANDSQTFNVVINLTSKCVVGTITDVTFAYTSFGALANGTGGGFNLKCTNSLPYKLGFTNAATPAATDAVTDDAVNLAYTLGVSAATGTGSGVDQAYSITGTMAAGQAGTCTTATCSNAAATNKQRTLYVVY